MGDYRELRESFNQEYQYHWRTIRYQKIEKVIIQRGIRKDRRINFHMALEIGWSKIKTIWCEIQKSTITKIN